MPRHKRGWGTGHGPNWRERHSPMLGSMLMPVLLFMIHKKRSHGYDLLEALNRYGLGTVHQSAVYRTLRDMEALGWVISTWDVHQSQGPARRVYTLTELGLEAVNAWSVELRQVQNIIDELLQDIKNE